MLTKGGGDQKSQKIDDDFYERPLRFYFSQIRNRIRARYAFLHESFSILFYENNQNHMRTQNFTTISFMTCPLEIMRNETWPTYKSLNKKLLWYITDQ